MMPPATFSPPSTTLPASMTAPVTGSVEPRGASCSAAAFGVCCARVRVRAEAAGFAPEAVVRLAAGRRGVVFFAVGRPAADFPLLAPVVDALAALALLVPVLLVPVFASPSPSPPRFELRRPGRDRGRL